MSWPKPPDAMRGVLAIVLVGAFMLALSWLFQHSIPAANEQLVTFMLGQLSGFAGAAVAYYLGTSKSSNDKEVRWQQRSSPPSTAEPDRPFDPGRDLPRPAFGVDDPDKGDIR